MSERSITDDLLLPGRSCQTRDSSNSCIGFFNSSVSSCNLVSGLRACEITHTSTFLFTSLPVRMRCLCHNSTMTLQISRDNAQQSVQNTLKDLSGSSVSEES